MKKGNSPRPYGEYNNRQDIQINRARDKETREMIEIEIDINIDIDIHIDIDVNKVYIHTYKV